MKHFVALVILLTCGSAFADLKVANDPAQVGIGARALGMGGVILNYNDISSLLGNPAALGSIKTNQYTMMAGKFINQMDYLSAGTVVPSAFGTFGITYLNSQLSFTGPGFTTEVVDGIRIIPSTTEVVTDTYRNSGIYLSYGRAAKEFYDAPILDKMLVGGTLKIFSQELNAGGLAGNAAGYEIDAGVQYRAYPWMNLSLVGKNILPASMGGKLTWKPTGREETYPYFLKGGLQVDLGGPESFINWENQTVSIGLEYDLRPQGNAPNLLHYGFEWGLGEILSIRLGKDQGYIGQGGTSVFDIANNLTYGVGVTYKGWRFDYAFHEYYDDAENNTSYFSLTYGLPFAAEKVFVEKAQIDPADKFITVSATVDITGKDLPGNIVSIDMQGTYVDVKGRAFSFPVSLKMGMNAFTIIGIDENRKEVPLARRRILRLAGFKDVPDDYWAAKEIGFMATLGLIKGYPNDIFKPDNGISRAEFASLLARMAGKDKYAPKEKLIFKDLSAKHWAYGAIAYGVDNELAKGYPDKSYQPNRKITRAEGIVVLARFAVLNMKGAVNEIPYPDMPGRHWAVRAVAAAKTAGWLGYLGDKFEPNEDFTRAEAAMILSGIAPAKDKVNDLTNFDKVY